MNIGENLKKLRRLNGYTQKALAEKIHVTPQAISHWELNEAEPSLDILNDLANIYHISFADITNENLDINEALKKKEEFEAKQKFAFWYKLKHKTRVGILISTISLAVVAISGSIAGIAIAVQNNNKNIAKAYGTINLNTNNYHKHYLEGDHFSFNKDLNSVSLTANDPLISNNVTIDDLPAPEYGFQVLKTDDTLEYYDNAEDIVINSTIENIYLRSKRYVNIYTPLEFHLYDVKPQDWKNELSVEGEQANIYKNGTLINQEDLAILPTPENPYLSNKGEAPENDNITNLSKGSCLRNFKKVDMKIEFTIVAKNDCTVDFKLGYCGRNESGILSQYCKIEINNETFNELNDTSIYSANYFTLLDIPTVPLNLKQGMNVLTLQSGKSIGDHYALNFDRIILKSSQENLAFVSEFDN